MQQKDNTDHHENSAKFPAIIFAATDSGVITVQLIPSYRAKVQGTSVGSLRNFMYWKMKTKVVSL